MIHVMRDGQQYGPYTLEDLNAHLAAGSLLPTDQAWYEGAPAWMPMNQVPGVVVPGAAPVAAVPQMAVPVDTNDPMAAADPAVAAQQTNASSAAGGSKKKMMIIAGSALAVLAAVGITGFWKPGFFVSGSSEDPLPGEGGGGGGEVDATKYASVQPIFEAHNCFKCHSSNAGTVKAKLDFDMPDTVKRHLLEEDGEINMMVRLADKDDPMPPEGDGTMLSTDELAKVKAWIDAGGSFD